MFKQITIKSNINENTTRVSIQNRRAFNTKWHQHPRDWPRGWKCSTYESKYTIKILNCPYPPSFIIQCYFCKIPVKGKLGFAFLSVIYTCSHLQIYVPLATYMIPSILSALDLFRTILGVTQSFDYMELMRSA